MDTKPFEKAYAKLFSQTPVADMLTLPDFGDLVKEYDSLSRRHWKRKRDLEHQMFWVAYKKFKFDN